jgi:putative transposase
VASPLPVRDFHSLEAPDFSWRTSDIELRKCKYLNNIVEQDHRAIKRIVRPMLGFKVFRCARILITGIETMHMIRKGQLDGHDGEVLSAADQFYSLAS